MRKMGPCFLPVPPCSKKTREAMTKHVVAEFIVTEFVVLGRLTPFGMAMRDMWINRDFYRQARARKKQFEEKLAGL